MFSKGGYDYLNISYKILSTYERKMVLVQQLEKLSKMEQSMEKSPPMMKTEATT